MKASSLSLDGSLDVKGSQEMPRCTVCVISGAVRPGPYGRRTAAHLRTVQAEPTRPSQDTLLEQHVYYGKEKERRGWLWRV